MDKGSLLPHPRKAGASGRKVAKFAGASVRGSVAELQQKILASIHQSMRSRYKEGDTGEYSITLTPTNQTRESTLSTTQPGNELRRPDMVQSKVVNSSICPLHLHSILCLPSFTHSSKNLSCRVGCALIFQERIISGALKFRFYHLPAGNCRWQK